MRHTISFVASAVATYSTFIVKYVGIDYLRDLREKYVDPRLVVYPEVENPISLPPSKYELVYPMSFKSSTLVYLSPLQVP